MSFIAITCGEIHIEGQFSIVEKMSLVNEYHEGDMVRYVFVMDNARKLEEVTQTTLKSWDEH